MAPPACSSSLGWPTTVVPSTTWVQCSTSSRLLSMMVASWATTTLISAVETSSMVFWCMHSRALLGVFEQVMAAEVVLHHCHHLATGVQKIGILNHSRLIARSIIVGMTCPEWMTWIKLIHRIQQVTATTICQELFHSLFWVL